MIGQRSLALQITKEALEAPEECCDENNCILVSKEFEKLPELPDVEKVTWPVLWAEMPVYLMGTYFGNLVETISM